MACQQGLTQIGCKGEICDAGEGVRRCQQMALSGVQVQQQYTAVKAPQKAATEQQSYGIAAPGNGLNLPAPSAVGKRTLAYCGQSAVSHAPEDLAGQRPAAVGKAESGDLRRDILERAVLQGGKTDSFHRAVLVSLRLPQCRTAGLPVLQGERQVLGLDGVSQLCAGGKTTYRGNLLGGGEMEKGEDGGAELHIARHGGGQSPQQHRGSGSRGQKTETEAAPPFCGCLFTQHEPGLSPGEQGGVQVSKGVQKHIRRQRNPSCSR